MGPRKVNYGLLRSFLSFPAVVFTCLSYEQRRYKRAGAGRDSSRDSGCGEETQPRGGGGHQGAGLCKVPREDGEKRENPPGMLADEAGVSLAHPWAVGEAVESRFARGSVSPGSAGRTGWTANRAAALVGFPKLDGRGVGVGRPGLGGI